MYFSYIHPVSKILVTDAVGYPVFNFHSRVIPGSSWSALDLAGPAPGSPQFLVTMGYGIRASPPETDQDSCSVWQPLYLVSLQKGFSPGPLTPRFKCFPATSIFPISVLCVFWVIYSVEPSCETTRRLEDFSNDLPNP